MLNIFLNLLSILLIANIVIVIFILFYERRTPSVTLAWIVILLTFPYVGLFFYLFFGRKLSRKKIYSLKKETRFVKMLLGQKKLLEQEKLIFYDWAAFENQSMIKLFIENADSIFSQNNDVEIFIEGKTKFDKLLEDIDNAKEHIHLLYFTIENDEIGEKIVKALSNKAKEGVEVRLLYDDISRIYLSKDFFYELEKNGGKVVSFFPSILSFKKIININTRINNRNHRKIAIIDSKIGYIGGLNIGDKYLGKDRYFGFWRDTHLRIRGNAVDSLQINFLKDWHFASKEKNDLRKFFQEKIEIYGKTGIQIVTCGPDSDWQQIKNGFLKMIYSAKKKIYIQTPYFIPDESILDALKIAVLSGLDVKIMIPCKPDHPFVYWANRSFCGELLEAGAKIYVYENGFLHSKLIVVDSAIASIGTANMDNRSFRLNFEINAFLYDHHVAENLEKIFLNDMKASKKFTYREYQKRGVIYKTKEAVSRLISPIL